MGYSSLYPRIFKLESTFEPIKEKASFSSPSPVFQGRATTAYRLGGSFQQSLYLPTYNSSNLPKQSFQIQRMREHFDGTIGF